MYSQILATLTHKPTDYKIISFLYLYLILFFRILRPPLTLMVACYLYKVLNEYHHTLHILKWIKISKYFTSKPVQSI